ALNLKLGEYQSLPTKNSTPDATPAHIDKGMEPVRVIATTVEPVTHTPAEQPRRRIFTPHI
ncbi:hypothetical protein FRC11_012044, partial [Ceratobasidium sp. 423]